MPFIEERRLGDKTKLSAWSIERMAFTFSLKAEVKSIILMRLGSTSLAERNVSFIGINSHRPEQGNQPGQLRSGCSYQGLRRGCCYGSGRGSLC